MIILLVLFGFTYILIASEIVDKTIAACMGAAAVIGLHFIPYTTALQHVDLNVIFLLVGMMIIVNIMGKTGLFEWLAVVIARKANGNGTVIIIMFLLITALFSSLLDNVTTIILIAPITILITQILELPTVPVLVLESIFSNIGGTATLVGDPPNVLIGSSTGLSFNQFLVNLAPIVVIILLVSLVVLFKLIRKRSVVRSAARERIMKAEPALAITDRKRLFLSLGVFSLVLAGFFLGRVLDIEPGIVALAGALLMALVCRVDIHSIMEKVEWSTIFFFIGLFILVGALQENGVFLLLGDKLINVFEGNLLLTMLAILWVSALASGIVDNIPLVIALIPLIQSIIPSFAQTLGLEAHPELVRSTIAEPLFWSLALGACLGGNGSLIGASANVVVAQIARKNRYHFSFWSFTRLGFPMMLLSLVLSSVYMYIRYHLLISSGH